jgi:hypothetical protein
MRRRMTSLFQQIGNCPRSVWILIVIRTWDVFKPQSQFSSVADPQYRRCRHLRHESSRHFRANYMTSRRKLSWLLQVNVHLRTIDRPSTAFKPTGTTVTSTDFDLMLSLWLIICSNLLFTWYPALSEIKGRIVLTLSILMLFYYILFFEVASRHVVLIS